MSNFEIKVQKIFIKPHPNADAIELGNIGSPDGWQVVVKKGLYQSSDLVVYIGENAVVPEWLLKKHGFWNEEKNIGMLAGKEGNRVKAIRLRGEFSLGICIPLLNNELVLEAGGTRQMAEGFNVTNYLGVTKYEPPIPTQMSGEVYNAGQAVTVNYDIENIKNWSDVFVDGEEVEITEKLHGSLVQLICIPHKQIGIDPSEHLFVKSTFNEGKGYIAVASKGLGASGLCFKHNDANKNNIYLRATQQYWDGIVSGMEKLGKTATVIILGEVFGDGIQDLKYGMKNTIGFRVFDIYLGRRGQGRYVTTTERNELCTHLGLESVPILYNGSFSKLLVAEYTQYTKSVFDSNQTREGIVIRPVVERQHPELGRVILKNINEDYLLRKGITTEHN